MKSSTNHRAIGLPGEHSPGTCTACLVETGHIRENAHARFAEVQTAHGALMIVRLCPEHYAADSLPAGAVVVCREGQAGLAW